MENEEKVNLSDLQEILHSDLSLDEIEKLKDGICVIGYKKTLHPKTNHIVYDFDYMTMNSMYIKSYFKELIANGLIHQYDRFRIYRECSTFFEANNHTITNELRDYIIPDDHLEARNGDSKHLDIDKHGKYIRPEITYTICIKGMKGFNGLTHDELIEKFKMLAKTYPSMRYIIMTNDFSYIYSGDIDIKDLSVIEEKMLEEEKRLTNGRREESN